MSFLSEIKENQSAEIINTCLELGSGVRRRIGNLGFVIGTKVKVLKVSLKKRTMLLELRGYVLTMETGICSKIKVKPI